MVKVSPSVMCMDFMDLKNQITALDNAGVDLYHIDIMDGHYVPNFCLNGDIMKSIRSVSKTPMDVHLMVTNPTDYIQFFADCGAEYISMHIETLDHPIRALKQVRDLGKKAGIAINPETDIFTLKYILDYIDMVIVMTVVPGFAGQTLIPSTVEKIRDLCRMFDDAGKNIDIMVDGQVKDSTAPMLVEAGANILVLGSSGLFNRYKPEEYSQAIKWYQNL